MKFLKELIQIVNKVKLRSIRQLGFPYEKDTCLGQLYEQLVDGIDEDEIAHNLTGKPKSSSAYRKMKLALEERLIASLFLIDLSQPSYNTRQKAYFEVHKKWAAIKILLGKGARQTAVRLSEQLLRQALRYEFNELAFDIVRSLRLYFGTLAGNQKKYLEYAEEANRLLPIVNAEIQAEAAYAHYVINYARKTKLSSAERQAAAKKAHEQMQPALQTYNAYTLHLYGSILEISRYSTASDYEKTDEVCDRIITFFEAKNYEATVPLQVAYYQKLLCRYQLRRFDDLEHVFNRGLTFFEEGGYNWFKLQETYLVLALHTEQYSTAYEVYDLVVNHNDFESVPEELAEYWRVLEAHLHFLIAIGELVVAEDNPRFSKFRLGRFLNNTPIFSKHKTGVNVSILVVQILFLVIQEKYGGAYDKISAIEQYCRRHLFTPDTMRSYYFVKALLELPKSSFHKAAVERKTAKYLQRLQDHPRQKAGQQQFISEIIPYEFLWQCALSTMSNKFYRKKRE